MMPREDVVSTFIAIVGGDEAFAVSILEANSWNLDAAVLAATGSGHPDPQGVSQQDATGMHDLTRAPMRTGYHETLLGPTSRSDELRLQREEEESRRRCEQERAELAQRRREVEQEQEQRRLEHSAVDARKKAELQALERRQALAKAKFAAKREQAMQEEVSGNELTKAAAEPATQPMPCMATAPQEVSQGSHSSALLSRPEEAGGYDSRLIAEAPHIGSTTAQEADGDAVMAPVAVEAITVGQALSSLRKRHKDEDPQKLVDCLETLKKYVDNITRNPFEVKFQRINCKNQTFEAKVGSLEGATDVLLACGFISDPAEHVLSLPPEFSKTKGSSLWDALAKIDVVLDQAKRKVGS